MAGNLVPIWHKYTLTVQEASQYFRIGEDKLRRIINESDDQSFVIWNGNRPQIKRIQFEKLVDRLDTI